VWFMKGATIVSTGSLGDVGSGWLVQSINAR
jgi:hypothetical protein